jgi:streptogramin lyase
MITACHRLVATSKLSSRSGRHVPAVSGRGVASTSSMDKWATELRDFPRPQQRSQNVRPYALLVLVAAFVVVGSSASARDLKGDGPTSLAVAFESLWIGMGNGDVVRREPRTGRVQARLRGSATGFVHDLVATKGAVWVVRDGLTRIDPRTNVARDVPGVPSATAFAISAGARALWVVDSRSNAILRVDPKRVRVVARIRLRGHAWGIAAGRAVVVAVSVPAAAVQTGPKGPRLLRRIDPVTNRLAPPLTRLGCDAGIAVGDRAVWTLDVCTTVLARRDAATLRVVLQRKFAAVSQTPVLAFGSIWLASRGGVLRVDPATLRIVRRIPARSLSLTVGTGSVWAFDPPHGRVREIDPATSRVIGSIGVGRTP